MNWFAFRSRPPKTRTLALALPNLNNARAPTDWYVPPRVCEASTGEIVSIDHLASRYSRAVFLGGPGAGKTAALAFLADGEPVLALSDYHPLAPPPLSPGLTQFFLDDVSAGRAHSEYLERIDRQFPNSQIYIAAEDATNIPANFARLHLLPFHERESNSAVRVWLARRQDASAFAAAVKRDPLLRRMAARPLDLFLLLQVYLAGRALPSRRAALFQAYLEEYCKREADPDFASRALEGIALSTKRGQLAKEEHLERGYGLLTQERGRIAFKHSALHDFLAARALTRNPDAAPLLEHLPDENWRQVVLFYVGLASPDVGANIIRALCEREQPALAASACAYAESVPKELASRVEAPLLRAAWESADEGAIAGLREMRSSAAAEFFAARLKDREPADRMRAASILGALQNDRAVEALLPALRDADSRFREAAAAALGETGSDKVIEPLLVALRGENRAAGSDPRFRAAAARALGRLGSEKAVPALLVELQIGEPPVRKSAAAALAEIRSELSRKPLQALAESGAADDVRSLAREILEKV